MRIRNVILLVIACLASCTRGPIVTKGKFTTSYTMNMQRGAVDIVVQTSGPASYTITQYQMNHPMDRRPDTEATFVTPAGTFAISNRGLMDAGLNVNGVFYPEPDANGRSTITIDANGGITTKSPKDAAPPDKDYEVKKARLNALHRAYQVYEVSNGKSAKKVDDLALPNDDADELKRWLNLDELGMSLLDAKKDDLSVIMMAYEKAAPKDGGLVMFYDGSVHTLSAADVRKRLGIKDK